MSEATPVPGVERGEYREEWLEGIPENVIATFAGTGNPFNMGVMQPRERVARGRCGSASGARRQADRVDECRRGEGAGR